MTLKRPFRSNSALSNVSPSRPVIPEAERYTYVIVNDDFARAVSELQAIVVAERCRRQVRLPQVRGRYPVDWSRSGADDKE